MWRINFSASEDKEMCTDRKPTEQRPTPWNLSNIYFANKYILILKVVIRYNSFYLGLTVSRKSGHLLTYLNTGSVYASKCHKSEPASLPRNGIASYFMHWMKPYVKTGHQIRTSVIYTLRSISLYIIFLSSDKSF